MITFKQFLLEWAYTPKSIDVLMKQKGYVKLGKGVDQTAYLEPKTGKVLKIFGADDTKGNRMNFSEAQMMFKDWANYCAKNKSNKFLPKFDGWEAFELDNHKFLQIRMEKLQKLPPILGKALGDLAARLDVSKNKQQLIQIILDELFDDTLTFNKKQKNKSEELNKLMILLGKKDFKLFLNTIAELSDMCRTTNYTFDLHENNFMHRNDGIPVIVDPWVV